MSDFIPPDLLIEVLKRLSVEDLVRSQIVCKSWYSLITNPSFISLHAQNQTSPTNNENGSSSLLLVRSFSKHPNRESYSIRFNDDSFREYKGLDIPFKPCYNPHFRVIGVLNGVVCLSDDVNTYSNIIILWNPSIRKFVTLPKPKWYGCFNHSIGFAFIAATNEYKVVRVFHLEEGMVVIVPPEVEVYDVSSGYWRRVDPKGFPFIVYPKSPQAFVNGALHWVGRSQTQTTDGYYNMIVSFDMETEVLKAIEMPESVANHWSWPRTYRVSVVGESLSVIHPTTSGNGYMDLCCIWVMKQYGKPESWAKLFTIDLVGRLENAFGFLKNGLALVTVCTRSLDGLEMYRGRLGSKLASYDPESKQVKDLGIEGLANVFYVDHFVESLALLGVKGGESVKEAKSEDKDGSQLLPPWSKLGVSMGKKTEDKNE